MVLPFLLFKKIIINHRIIIKNLIFLDSTRIDLHNEYII